MGALAGCSLSGVPLPATRSGELRANLSIEEVRPGEEDLPRPSSEGRRMLNLAELERLSFVFCSKSSTASFAKRQHSPGVSAGTRVRSLFSSARCFAVESGLSLSGPSCFRAVKVRRPCGLSTSLASFMSTGKLCVLLLAGVGLWLGASSPRTQRSLIADSAVPCKASVWRQQPCRRAEYGSAKSDSKH